MKVSLKESVRGTDGGATFSKTGTDGCTTQFSLKHARIPWEVGTDERLSDRDVRVYFALASFTRKSPRASAGTRWISECVHIHRNNVLKSLKRLTECGHIEIAAAAHGKRNEYRLTSPLFEHKGEGASKLQLPPKESRSVGTCTHCHQSAKRIFATGYCPACSKAIETERRFEATAALIGPNATEDQVLQRMGLESQRAKVRRDLRRARKAA